MKRKREPELPRDMQREIFRWKIWQEQTELRDKCAHKENMLEVCYELHENVDPQLCHVNCGKHKLETLRTIWCGKEVLLWVRRCKHELVLNLRELRHLLQKQSKPL